MELIVKILPPKNIILYMGLTLLNYMFLKWIGIYDHDDVPAQDDHECQAPDKMVLGFWPTHFYVRKTLLTQTVKARNS